MTNNDELLNIALRILNELEGENNSIWKSDSKFRKYRDLQIDKRGSFGERFIKNVLSQQRNVNLQYFDGDQGDWDISINDVKLEIKTSSLDVNNKFQNERIKKDGDYDGIAFLGIAPDTLYIKFIKQSAIDFDKLHNRGKRGTGAGYKWDFKIEDYTEIKIIDDVFIEYQKIFACDNKKIKQMFKKKK